MRNYQEPGSISFRAEIQENQANFANLSSLKGSRESSFKMKKILSERKSPSKSQFFVMQFFSEQ
jgi:hypothetical protein